MPLDATTVNTDLTQYLEDQWKPIIDSDIDGPGSTAQQIDLDRPNLGQRFVTQHIARTIFMGAAPRIKSTRKGLDKQYLWLGTAVPVTRSGNFGSAVELLAQRSTLLLRRAGPLLVRYSALGHEDRERLRRASPRGCRDGVERNHPPAPS